jgi:hypothetical protein
MFLKLIWSPGSAARPNKKSYFVKDGTMEAAAAVEDESSTSSASPDDKGGNVFRNPEDLAQFVISGEEKCLFVELCFVDQS